MSQWARENPEQMAEIAALPPSKQNQALREAIVLPDEDAIRDQAEMDELDDLLLDPDITEASDIEPGTGH